ncbi:Methyltransferase domain-containing protein [Sphingobium sp. YR657]|nr:Methyltransferase domain-containing protein [Sphingobium sp. YR657]
MRCWTATRGGEAGGQHTPHCTHRLCNPPPFGKVRKDYICGVRDMAVDRSEGYEGVADEFIAARSDIDASFVRSWAREELAPRSTIVDVACGSGVPIAQALIEDGFIIFGIDASPSLLAALRLRFPDVQVACEAVQDSVFFRRAFDAAVAIGLLFLLFPEDQRRVFYQVANALRPGGRFLFTAPRQACEWRDVLTGRQSRSLGEAEYRRLVEASGLQLVGCHERENFFYDAVKPAA